MHHITFLQDLAVVMIVASVVTVLFRRLKQPVVLGYILAGVIIGPHTDTFLFIAEEEHIATLSELGVIFLMFALGLEFSLRKLKEVGATALIAATFEILLMVWAGYQLGRSFGWNQMDSVFLGAILAISSTTIIIKALEELGKTRESFAQLIFGILIVEDILAILMIAMLSGFATTGSLSVGDVAMTLGKLSTFLVVLLIVGLILVPRLLNYIARFKSNEMLLVTVTGLCFGVSLLTVKLGYSVALGAFLIGAIIAEARQIAKIEELMHPVRDLFSAVFFVSIGLLIDPALLKQYWVPIVVITVVVVVGKVASCSFGTFIAGNDLKSSMRVGMGLAQIGEFSFIIAALGQTLKVTSGFVYPIAVAVSALTTLLTPYLIRASDPIVEGMTRLLPRPVTTALDAYTRWMSAAQGRKVKRTPSMFLRKWGWQIALNLGLIAGIFIVAVFMKTRALTLWPNLPVSEDNLKGVLWLTAMILSLPMLIAIVRKWQAFGMLVSEMTVPRAAGGDHTSGLRWMISSIVFVAGCVGLVLLMLLLSSAVLPSWNLLIVLLLVFLVAVFLLRRSFTKLHSKAQIALVETLQAPPVEKHEHAPPIAATAALPSMLHDAKMELVVISAESKAVGKMISELMLRTESGASIVGIERGQENIINPPSDEEIRAGDSLLLIGSDTQIQKAHELLR